ncbi:MAG: hypothetical protein S4CHLAM7_08240 [Chlamydiae bacterium]|nr:hypothetical protein [Chlamydiota bacterium]
MEKFRKTSIRSKRKNAQSSIVGDLVESGAIIFTKTQVDLQTIRRGDAFWRLLIRMVQWFRWFRIKGDPSTITHVDGWDGKLAFGSDLCDPDGGGLNRHVLPIVPHCFMSSDGATKKLVLKDGTVEVINKKKHSQIIRIEDLSTCDFEIIQLPEKLRNDFLIYQQKFRNDDVKYSLKKAAKTVVTNAKFCLEAKKSAVADGIYVYLQQPFRSRQGAVHQVCCSTFLAKILMAIEHKQRIEEFIDCREFELHSIWKRNFYHLRRAFCEQNKYHRELIDLEKYFDTKWGHLDGSRESKGQLIELCLDFSEQRSFLVRRIRRLSSGIAHRIYRMADTLVDSDLYDKYFDNAEMPILFKMHPDRVTPAKLYYYLMEILERNEP